MINIVRVRNIAVLQTTFNQSVNLFELAIDRIIEVIAIECFFFKLDIAGNK